jgi:hypothetical protein
MSSAARLAMAVIESGVLDLKTPRRIPGDESVKRSEFLTAQRFLTKLSKTLWGELAASSLNIPEIERWAKKQKFKI